MQTIYLDNAATTKPLEELKEVYTACEEELWYNPSALYAPAVAVAGKLAEARETLLCALGAPGYKCFFTSCGTEGANTVILRGARVRKGMNFVCGGAEHPCVEESFKLLAAQGYPVKYVGTDGHGWIAPKDVAAAVDENTALVSVMHVNNETGAKNDIAAIGAAVKARNPQTLFHADGVQAYLRESVAAACGVVDYYTVSAHKVHAHKGTGAVFYRTGAPLKAYLAGGGQESALRSGTQNMLGILCFARAADYFMQHADGVAKRLAVLRKTFVAACEEIEDSVLITPNAPERACSHIVNLSFPGVAGETLLHTLEAAGIYISTGSACSSKKGRGRIAKALSLAEDVAAGAVRVSFSPFNTEEECVRAAEEIKKNIALLRRFKRV